MVDNSWVVNSILEAVSNILEEDCTLLQEGNSKLAPDSSDGGGLLLLQLKETKLLE